MTSASLANGKGGRESSSRVSSNGETGSGFLGFSLRAFPSGVGGDTMETVANIVKGNSGAS